MLKVPAHTIRFWVKVFDIKVKTGRGGTRYFTPDNVNELVYIHWLLKVKRYTIEGAIMKYFGFHVKLNYLANSTVTV